MKLLKRYWIALAIISIVILFLIGPASVFFGTMLLFFAIPLGLVIGLIPVIRKRIKLPLLNQGRPAQYTVIFVTYLFVFSLTLVALGMSGTFVLYPKLFEVKKEEKIIKISKKIPYENKEIDDKSLEEGKIAIDKYGEEGIKVVTYRITLENNEEVKRIKIKEEVKKEPQDEIVAAGTKKKKVVEKKNPIKSTKKTSFTFQNPSEFDTGSAERTLAEYALCWKKQDWEKMVEFTQETWLEKKGDPAKDLSHNYDFKKLKGFKINETKKVGNTTADITFTVQYEAFEGKAETHKITARVIKESAAYTPSEDGNWGVNPISTLRED